MLPTLNHDREEPRPERRILLLAQCSTYLTQPLVWPPTWTWPGVVRGEGEQQPPSESMWS